MIKSQLLKKSVCKGIKKISPSEVYSQFSCKKHKSVPKMKQTACRKTSYNELDELWMLYFSFRNEIWFLANLM